MALIISAGCCLLRLRRVQSKATISAPARTNENAARTVGVMYIGELGIYILLHATIGTSVIWRANRTSPGLFIRSPLAPPRIAAVIITLV